MLRATLMSAVLLLPIGTALAHEDHIGDHGGYTKHAGAVHLELVTDGASIKVYAIDPGSGKPLPLASGSKGRATVLAGGKTEVVALEASGVTLTGRARTPVPADAKVALTVELPGRDGIPPLTYNLAKKANLPIGTED